MNDAPSRSAPGWRRSFAGVLTVLALVGVACGGDDDGAGGALAVETASPVVTATSAPPASATPTPALTATPEDAPVAIAVATPSAQAVLAHIEALAGDIGVRAAGTAGERDAAEYLRGVLEAAGFVVAFEPFERAVPFDDSTFTVGDRGFAVFALSGGANGPASGRLVLAGIGTVEELAAIDAVGAIAVVDRGVIPFAEKAANAVAAGAAALVVVNTEDGPLFGTLGSNVEIPVVGVELAARPELHTLIETQAEGHVVANVGQRPVASQNVVATNGSVEDCRIILSGHYDSVPAGPGANDNASGTSMALELAVVYRRPGLCFVAFGAEELGLFGSRAFVSDHALATLDEVLNIDMAGKIDGAIIVGERALTQRIMEALEQAGGEFPIQPGSFGRFASSDQASFETVGIPAVTLNSGLDAGVIHTPQDNLDNVRIGDLETMLRIADIALRHLLEGLASP